MKNYFKYILVVIAVILLDQFSKLWVHFNMNFGSIGQIKLIGNWLKLYYTLNPGMAFGIELGFIYGKVVLTVGRILASIAIFYYIYKLCKNDQRGLNYLALSWSFVLGGALGNVIDSVFYGVYLGNAPLNAPFAWFNGQVIDMIFFDLFTYKVPDWSPFYAGYYVKSFPIFNMADVFITLGIAMILGQKYLSNDSDA